MLQSISFDMGRNKMNERIKELAIEARLIAPEYSDCAHTTLSPQEQKFAELIVRDCATIAREVGNNTETDDFALDRCYEIEDKIKEHFGVEE